ncbi:metal-dependent hydrolase [Motilimonas cestriensis]|uniref:Metal-dependent hydrolase n=1 Tax=Motilimonas cestriensis TaxID=2742685 RepID=A0ABS8WBK1_9GAMM|nr:metal-dependent hydrolase [Motilimonas cestriensis]MCE2595628.1 metal-dependent hydrolase [Motilimonas cestriensis]
MSPGTHLLFSWLSTAEILKNRRERAIVSISGIAPDIDGIGIVIDEISGTTDLYFQYHHYLGHSFFSALIISVLAMLIAKTQKCAVFVLSFILVHIHILFDVIGSKSADGYQWPIYYLYPLNAEFFITWDGQWELNAWQNQVVMLCLLAGCGYYAVTKKITFLEVFSSRVNDEFFKMYFKYIHRNT